MPAPRVWRGKWAKQDGGEAVDLYAPGTPDFARRTRETHTELAPGTVRIDLGAPLPRLAHEPQPVTFDAPAEAEDPPSVPANPPSAPAPAPSLNPFPPKDWRDDYGVTRDR